MHESKHVPAGLGDSSHLGENWEVVDDKRDLAALLSCQRLSVSQDAKACDVGGCMGVEGVHKASSCEGKENVFAFFFPTVIREQ